MKLTRELAKLRTISRSINRRSTTLTRDCYPWREILGITVWDSTISQSQHEKIVLQKLRDILENDLQLQPSIENTHRIGPFKDDGTPRPILAKFLYRPERFSTSLVLSKRKGICVMVCVFRMIWYGKTVKRRSNWDLLWKRHLKLGKDLDFIMASYTLTVR